MENTSPCAAIRLSRKAITMANFKELRQIYEKDNFFPLDIRLEIADWIETKFIPDSTLESDGVNNQTSQQHAITISSELIAKFDEKIQEIPNEHNRIANKVRLQDMSIKLKEAFKDDLILNYTLHKAAGSGQKHSLNFILMGNSFQREHIKGLSNFRIGLTSGKRYINFHIFFYDLQLKIPHYS